MRKWIIITLIIIGLIAFFYPKQKIFSCGPICSNEEAAKRIENEIANTIWLGYGYEPRVSDATIKICYGIFINR